MDDAKPLTFGSLFAGIGGFDLGFERAGMVCKWQVEIDDYANRVLAKHWPAVHRERDIRQCGAHNLQPVDVVCGGFPCQDISYAGLGAGLDGERSGLFFEAVRVVRELQPRVVVLENVAALLTRGLDRVLGTLAAIGYDAEWHCIPAAAVGAPHIRDRVFVVAYRKGDGWQQGQSFAGGGAEGIAQGEKLRSGNGCQDVADTDNKDKSKHEKSPRHSEQKRRATPTRGKASRQEDRKASNNGTCRHGEALADTDSVANKTSQNAFTESPERHAWLGSAGRSGPCRSASDWWATEPDVGRVADGVPNRVDRLRGLGNAVVPQVAEWIGRRIVEQQGG